jgi:hypothetical protein
VGSRQEGEARKEQQMPRSCDWGNLDFLSDKNETRVLAGWTGGGREQAEQTQQPGQELDFAVHVLAKGCCD